MHRSWFVYVDMYTGDKSKGIYVLRFDSATGRLANLGLAAESRNPSFLALHPDGNLLYALNEIDDFTIKGTWSEKTGPCRLALPYDCYCPPNNAACGRRDGRPRGKARNVVRARPRELLCNKLPVQRRDPNTNAMLPPQCPILNGMWWGDFWRFAASS
jgi:hypothetical protein